jgi:F420-dependent oxidoreductase-like protein
VHVGLKIGSDRLRPRAERVIGLVEDVQEAEAAGFSSLWMPQPGGYLDALTALAVVGQATHRIELGSIVVPVQTRHPLTMAQQALTVQAASRGRFTLGIGASHHWIVEGQLGLPYERPAALVRDYLEVLDAAFAGPGMVDVDNDSFQVHSPFDILDPTPMPIVIAALAPMMLKIAGAQAAGTMLWMADERTIADHVAPLIGKAAHEAGRPAPRIIAGVPVALCPPSEVDAAREYTSDLLGRAERSPNYVRLLDHGDAGDVGDTMAVGDESAVLARLQRYRDAGVTDLAARIIALGPDTEARQVSHQRTLNFLTSLCPQL